MSALSHSQESTDAVQRPRIVIAGDSTAARGNGETIVGWGSVLADYFDSEKVEVLNRARGGRSSRTFITEGHWERMLLEVEQGDVVLIQFGHNDSGAINREPPGSTRPLRARGSLPGLGEESEVIENAVTGKHEVVYSYGHYLRKMITDTREKGATPVLLSLTARNIWKDGRIERGSGMYGAWAYELARELDVAFVDVTDLAADRLEAMGAEAVAGLYPNDPTHTGSEGARLHAEAVVTGLKGLRLSPVEGWLSEKGAEIETHDWTWLNLPRQARADVPSVFLIGDSTVRNGRGDGKNGEWGWGDFLDPYFNEAAVNVVNRAVGGMSSRTYYTSGFWDKVKTMIRPGDFVVMQFGHNDSAALNDESRARGTIKGIGDAFETIDNLVAKQREEVHSYGWYLRRYTEEARELGATPIVCSLVPRKIWDEEGNIVRSGDSYAGWAQQVAEEECAFFLDLNNRVADRYDGLGKRTVDTLFADKHTHTSRSGAVLNGQCVAEALRELEGDPLAAFMTVNIGNGRPVTFRFTGAEEAGEIKVSTDAVYDAERGYGFDLGTAPGEGGAFYFSVAAEDGNYRLDIEFGDGGEGSSNTVKAESRRLLLEKVTTKPGELVWRSAIVNTRDDRLVPPLAFAPGGTQVVLNEREIGKLHWDDKLTIEFNGTDPKPRCVRIEKVDVPTVYLIGDSTVTDQPYEPAASWGQMLPRFFKPTVAVANHAESGETMKSFISGLRLAKVLQSMKAGDYLFIQFTHNDQKEQWPQTYVEAGSTYKAYLKVLIAEARLRGATPVLVTSMERRRFNENGKIVSTLGDYPAAMRAVAKEESVALIDLQPMSVALYEALGVVDAPKAFSNGGKDATHHNNYGAYQLAQCVAEGIRAAKLPLADALVDTLAGFDASRPDNVDTFQLAPSPFSSELAPLGN